jgi:nitronate monooxygenase
MMMATRFLATKDCRVHPNIYKILMERDETQTALGLKKLLANFGLQVRALRNDIVKRIEEIEARDGDFSELFPLISGDRAKQAWQDGNAEEALLTVGQSVGRIQDIPTVAELVERIAAEAETALRRSLEQVSP